MLLVDGAIVGSTSTAALHPQDFVARFDGAMLLQLLQMPRQVRGVGLGLGLGGLGLGHPTRDAAAAAADAAPGARGRC